MSNRTLALDVSEQYTAIADRIELIIAPAAATLDARLARGEAGRYDFAFIDPLHRDTRIDLALLPVGDGLTLARLRGKS